MSFRPSLNLPLFNSYRLNFNPVHIMSSNITSLSNVTNIRCYVTQQHHLQIENKGKKSLKEFKNMKNSLKCRNGIFKHKSQDK